MRFRKIFLVTVLFSLFTVKAFSATIETNVNFNHYSDESMHLGFAFSFTEMVFDDFTFTVLADLPYYRYNAVQARLDYIIARFFPIWFGGLYNYRWEQSAVGLNFGAGFQTGAKAFYMAVEGRYFFDLLKTHTFPNFDVLFRFGWAKPNFDTYFQYHHEEYTGENFRHLRRDFIDFYVKMMSTVTSVYTSLEFAIFTDFFKFNPGNFKFRGKVRLGLLDEMGTEYFFGAEFDQSLSNSEKPFGIFVGTKLSF
ncbi:MAG: hypothetical protein IIW10_00550 [Spirochaetaceae bacterium]|nr:hypothetical protein [Spirochaetaceae bacterium]